MKSVQTNLFTEVYKKLSESQTQMIHSENATQSCVFKVQAKLPACYLSKRRNQALNLSHQLPCHAPLLS